MNEDATFIVDQVDRHHAWFQKSLCLIASENVMSPLALEMYLSDFGHRYAEGLPGKRYYQGNTYVDEVEVRITEMLKRIFGCTLADPRPVSGTVANLAVLFGLTKPGDTITTVALSDGAHISTAKFG
ncbi:MAG: serine hydroxymethyltransferase, partial [Thermoplasmata archaeon]